MFLALALLVLPTFDPATTPPIPSAVGVLFQPQVGGTLPEICQTCEGTTGAPVSVDFGVPVCIAVSASIEPTRPGTCRENHQLCVDNEKCAFTLHYEYTLPPGGTVEADSLDSDMEFHFDSFTNETGGCVSGSGNLLESVTCGGGGVFTVIVTDHEGTPTAWAEVTYDCGDPCPD